MSQSNIGKIASTVALITLSLYAFSCAPKAAGVRAQVKTGQTNMDPAISTVSQQQAMNQGVNYQIRSISLPNDVAGGQIINVELVTPGNQYLPLTTQHIDGALETQGNYTDSARGLTLNVQARCSTDACGRYDLLLTVTKGGVRVFQTGAVSYKQDCKFFAVSIGSNVSQLFANLAAFTAKYNPYAADDAQNGSCNE